MSPESTIGWVCGCCSRRSAPYSSAAQLAEYRNPKCRQMWRIEAQRATFAGRREKSIAVHIITMRYCRCRSATVARAVRCAKVLSRGKQRPSATTGVRLLSYRRGLVPKSLIILCDGSDCSASRNIRIAFYQAIARQKSIRVVCLADQSLPSQKTPKNAMQREKSIFAPTMCRAGLRCKNELFQTLVRCIKSNGFIFEKISQRVFNSLS